MRRLVLIISVIVSAVLLLADCKSQNQTRDIPYTVCEGYFVRNDADKVPLGKITSQSEFDKLFGMAAVMGRSITPIDFSKQFVIAVSEKPTANSTTYSPLSLVRSENGIVFSYGIERGSKISYVIQPLLLIVVDKKYESEVEVVAK